QCSGIRRQGLRRRRKGAPRIEVLVRDGRQNWFTCSNRRLKRTDKSARRSLELSKLAQHHEVAQLDLLQHGCAGDIGTRSIDVACRVARANFEIDRVGFAGDDISENASIARAVWQTMRFLNQADDLN